MKVNLASYAAALSVFGFLGWIAVGARTGSRGATDGGALTAMGATASNDAPGLREQPVSLPDDPLVPQERTSGSAVPCAVPLGWYVARVDEPFALSQADATQAVSEAVALWEDATGRVLFSHESGGELPVRFMYDDRQERAEERRRLTEEFNQASAILDAEMEALNERRRRYNDMLTRYEEELQDLERRVTTLNDSIRYWNDRGGAPADVLPELASRGRALDAERADLTARGNEIDTLQERLAADSEQFNREVEAHRTEGEAIEAAFPAASTQSGAYREALHMRDGRLTSVTREIWVYRFVTPENLVRVIAHELGHALGLGHTDVPGALMGEEFAEPVSVEGTPRVQPTDVQALRDLCPRL